MDFCSQLSCGRVGHNCSSSLKENDVVANTFVTFVVYADDLTVLATMFFLSFLFFLLFLPLSLLLFSCRSLSLSHWFSCSCLLLSSLLDRNTHFRCSKCPSNQLCPISCYFKVSLEAKQPQSIDVLRVHFIERKTATITRDFVANLEIISYVYQL